MARTSDGSARTATFRTRDCRPYSVGMAARIPARSWLRYLTIGLAGVVAYLLLPASGPARSILFTVASASTVPAIIVGVRAHRPDRTLPWHLLAAGMGLYSVATFVWFPLARFI